MQITNLAKEKLAAGELAIGVGLRQARTVDIAKAMKTAGFDWLFIDMEHSSMNLDCAVQISLAAQDVGITPVVRVPGFEHHHATRVLDGGAQGIVVPHVDTPEITAQMAQNCKYPPLGKRSVVGALPQLDFRAAAMAEATRAINESTLLVVMVETAEAVANAAQMAAVPGIDALLIGTNDLCMELGIPGQLDHPKVVDAYEKVIAACRTHGKYPGMGGVYNPVQMAPYIEMGMQLILAGSDLSLMLSAGKQQSAAVRALKGQ